MKNKLLRLISVFLIFVTVLCLSACGFSSGSASATIISQSENTIVIEIDSTDGKATLTDVLKTLKSQGKLTYESTNSTYGEYIVSVNGKSEVANGTEGYSWMIYTSDTEISDVNNSIENSQYFSAMLGMSSIIVKQGYRYVLNYTHWSF